MGIYGYNRGLFVSPEFAMNPRLSAVIAALRVPVGVRTWLPQLFTLAILLALCWSLARWTWVLLTPLPSVVADAPAQGAAVNVESVLNAHLFGASTTSTPETTTTLSMLGLKLRGVFAGEGKQGVAAIITVQQKDKPVKVGDEIVPGVVLSHVYADHVELTHQGVKERLNLECNTAGSVAVNPPVGVHP